MVQLFNCSTNEPQNSIIYYNYRSLGVVHQIVFNSIPFATSLYPLIWFISSAVNFQKG
jgi:hypothetical protein